MPKIKLTYFDFHGGRGEPARLALHIAGVEFEDERLQFKEWPQRKPTTPFGGVPVLEVDGQTVAQSNGINRYVGRLSGLYPKDPWQAALCDEAMDAVEAIAQKVFSTLTIKDEAEKKRVREALADGPIRFYLEKLQARLEAHGGEWFADGRLTVADLRVFVFVGAILKGSFDYVPAELVDRVAPALAEHHRRVAEHPKIAAYYETRG